MKNKKFQLFQCCIPVKGINQGIIIDFQRKSIHTVSNQMIDVINEYSNKSIYDLFYDFNNSKSILKKYIRYFILNELVIISDDISPFRPISNDFIKPYLLDTISIEIEVMEPFLIDFICNEIDKYGVISLKLIIKKDVVKNLLQILALLKTSKIQSISVFVEFSEEVEEQLKEIIGDYPRLTEVIFCNTDIKKDLKDLNFYYEILGFEEILYKKIKNENHFILDIDLYNESLKKNSIYNKSLFIDKSGDVKNHIIDLKKFGNISYEKLENIINDTELKEFWNITKDQIEVCKDCEFRYICPDGRIPFKDNETEEFYKHKTKCNYNPYENSWES